ncbi:CapA family protein [Cellulomonas dongxiuzhuiae]|uniref:CapA family protein n=1 Tax=Cellulomonas dongxiuzhuiae TaxID=2819979 RepID=UPI0027DCB298|nr:CapA family protein [Cellulomonas dongxiuzhuiae]
MPRHARDPHRPVLPVAVAGALTGLVLVGAVGAAGAFGSVAGRQPSPVAPTVAGAHLDAATPTPVATPAPTREPDVELAVVATGDVLPHLPVLRSARDVDGYDFDRLLGPLDPWVEAADLALCHLEVPVAPAGSAPSGYPVFGAPAQLVDGLADQGWDGCSTASNHSVDRGWAGVTATLDALDTAGLGHVGTARSGAEDAQPQLYRLERSGRTVTVAHLAATYGTNGMPVDVDKPWSVRLIDADDLVRRATDARAAGADVVLLSLHWGTEYRTAPTDVQRTLAQRLAASGAVDLVIGHHAHVPQPVEHLAGGPGGQGMWVAYGLGNYVSNQDEACCVADTASGLLLTAQVVAPGADPAAGTAAGPARVVGVQWTPITVDRRGGHGVHALADIPDGTATLDASQVARRLALVREAAGAGAPERTTPALASGPPPTVVPRTR